LFRPFFAFLLASLAFLGSVRDAGAESIRARVRLFGACADTAALAGELSRRGVELEVLAPDAEAPLVVALAVDVTPGGAHHAALTLLDESGARDDRTLEARNCSELRAAAAWVLISLARERKALREAPSPSPVAVFPDAPASVTPAAPVSEPQQSPTRDTVSAVAVPRQKAETRSFRLATAFALGVGMTDELAFGARLSAEYAALRTLGVRLSALSLSTSGIRAEEAVASIDRRALQLAAVLRPESLPLWLAGGVELGVLDASATGLATSGEDAATWLSLPIAGGADLPLLAKVLSLHVAGGLAFAPSAYRLTASDQTLLRASQLEIRAEFGLSGRL